MMVGEVTGSGHVQRTFSSGSLLEADMVYQEPMADILTVLRFAGVPVRLMVVGRPCIRKVISVIRTVGRLKIMREILGRTDVILLFRMDMVGFTRIMMTHCRRLCSLASCFVMRTLPSRHKCSQIEGMCLYRHYRFLRTQ